MGGLKEIILEKLPTGSEIGDIYSDPADENKIIIEYILEGKVHLVSPEREDINQYIDYAKGIYFREGLTYNDVYEIISCRHQLNLVKGIDYPDSPELVSSVGRIFIPTHNYSLRFFPSVIIVDIIDINTSIVGTEDQRNISHLSIKPEKSTLEDNLQKLSFTLFDCRAIKCFEEGKVTIEFRQLIANSLDATLTETKKEILSSFMLDSYSDALSDVAVLVSGKQIPYIIRYVSANGDVP